MDRLSVVCRTERKIKRVETIAHKSHGRLEPDFAVANYSSLPEILGDKGQY